MEELSRNVRTKERAICGEGITGLLKTANGIWKVKERSVFVTSTYPLSKTIPDLFQKRFEYKRNYVQLVKGVTATFGSELVD